MSENSPVRLPPLVVRRDVGQINEPFQGDLLQRKKLAETLTGYIDRLHSGAVIGVSAPWGDGKTWFAKHWAAQLKADRAVAYIDAFANDFVSDPFVLLASELTSLVKAIHETAADVKGATGRDLKRGAGAVMKAIVPIGTKIALNAAGRILLGSADLSKEVAAIGDASLGDVAAQGEKLLDAHFKELDEQRQSTSHFRQVLTEAVAVADKPVVVFIDELDRCKPSFAVALIERLKHFFDVENLVFVLMLNRQQLERAIESVHGVGTDGHAYLGKFVALWFELPRDRVDPRTSREALENFVGSLLLDYSIPERRAREAEDFRTHAALWVGKWRLSLRDVERMCSLFVLGGMRGGGFVSYLIALKVRDRERFARVRAGDAAAHEACAAELRALAEAEGEDAQNEYPATLLTDLALLHSDNASRAENGDTLGRLMRHRELGISNMWPSTVFRSVGDWIDLPMEPQ